MPLEECKRFCREGTGTAQDFMQAVPAGRLERTPSERVPNDVRPNAVLWGGRASANGVASRSTPRPDGGRQDGFGFLRHGQAAACACNRSFSWQKQGDHPCGCTAKNQRMPSQLRTTALQPQTFKTSIDTRGIPTTASAGSTCGSNESKIGHRETACGVTGPLGGPSSASTASGGLASAAQEGQCATGDCCCCVESAEAKVIKKPALVTTPDNVQWVETKFVVTIKFTYKGNRPPPRDCKVKWTEKVNVPMQGRPLNQWHDPYELQEQDPDIVGDYELAVAGILHALGSGPAGYGEAMTLLHQYTLLPLYIYNKKAKKKCPGKYTLQMVDSPAATTASCAGRQALTWEFDISAQSAPKCPCDKAGVQIKGKITVPCQRGAADLTNATADFSVT